MNELTYDENQLIVSKTDTSGKITYGNELFLKLSGFQEREILGAPHNIIRHKDMPKVIFKLLWDTLKEEKEVYAYVKNRSKNGDYYWVFANVTPSYDNKGSVIGYYSVRRKPTQKALDTIKPIYNKLLHVEQTSGMDKAKNILTDLIAQSGGRYDKFILSI